MGFPAACGPDNVQYKVKTDKQQTPLDPAPAGKALLVFVQSLDGDFGAQPTSRFAVDGVWVGADKGKSYFSAEVAPGKHAICASRQASLQLEKDNLSTAGVDLKPGQIYFYEFMIKRTAAGSPEMRVSPQGLPGSSMTSERRETTDTADLRQLDNDAGYALARRSARAVSVTK